ncbi:MAG: MHS family MFS transporter [Gammaproteobacteria bacterium]|nr:MHS family MFS transporter [Gammaproteobacteria bacterium]
MFKKSVYTNSFARIYLLGTLGTIIEWYDFAIYGYLANIFSHIFFINKNRWLSLIIIYSVFFISYLVRPIGALIYGYIGDYLGRRQALILSTMMMSFSMLIIACLPTYDKIGSAAAVFLGIFRIIQGISAGGETTGAFVYVLESVNKKQHGFYGGAIWAMVVAGILLSSVVVTALTHLISHSALLTWGWRIAYLIGFILGVIIFFLRVFMPESTAFEKARQQSAVTNETAVSPLKDALLYHKRAVLLIALLSALPAAEVYFTFFYFPQFSHQYLHQTLLKSLNSNTLMLLIMMIAVIAFGYLSGIVKSEVRQSHSIFLRMFFENIQPVTRHYGAPWGAY